MASRAAWREVDVLRITVDALQQRLPPGWRATVEPDSRVAPDQGVDALVTLAAPGGAQVTVLVECKIGVVTRDLPGLVEQLRQAGGAVDGPTVPLIATRYLSASVRDWLDRNGISYSDATGNLRLAVASPGAYLFMMDRGADQDPWRGPGRPRGTLKGAPAARVVRALADLYTPIPISTLIREARSSTGVTYRVLDFLEKEALVTRGTRGLITEVRWRPLLERWSRDYSFPQDNTVSQYLQPRGVPALLSDLPTLGRRMNYAVTGSLAAQQWAPYAPARLATVFVEDVTEAARGIGLRSTDRGANVLLAAPGSDVVFDRTQEIDGVRYAAPSQVATDLLTGPGRNPSEGQELLNWMESDEPAWRQLPGRGAERADGRLRSPA